MKKLIFLFLSLINLVMAQLAPQPLPELEHLEGQSYLFQWEGVPGRVYFIQTSSQNPSATGFSWQFAPDIRVGEGNQIEMGFEANAANTEFFRLVYTDYSGSQDPDFADFDNDGYTNLEEAIANTDPFDAQYFPGGSNGGGNNGGGGNAGGGGNGGGTTTNWNHPWEYKLTYEVGSSPATVATINRYNAVGDYSYVRDRGTATELITKLTFEDVVGTNKVRFLQYESNENHDSSDPESTESKFVGVVELSEDHPEWSHAATLGTKTDGELTPVTVEKINFSGESYYELKSDDLSETFEKPHYNRSTDLQKPVAFKRQSKPEVEVYFTLDLPGELLARTEIQGVGSDGVVFGADAVEKIEGTGLVRYKSKKENTTAFPNEIKFYDRSVDEEAFIIDWQIRVDGSPFKSIGETKHQVYVTLDDPAANLSDYHETLFWLSCKAGDGKANMPDLINEVWKVFETREVVTVKGDNLFYYNDFNNIYSNTHDLLTYFDGQCGAWVQFFLGVLRAHGFDQHNEKVTFTPSSDDAMFIHSWENAVQYGTSSIQPVYTHVNIPYFFLPLSTPGEQIGSFPPNGNQYDWFKEEVADENEGEGLPGQGENNNPASIFTEHIMAYINGEYFDPSYGEKYTSLGQIEDEIVSRFALIIYDWPTEVDSGIDYNSNGVLGQSDPHDTAQVTEFHIRENSESSMLLRQDFINE